MTRASGWLWKDRARLGISEFRQRVNGDIAFANVASAGTNLQVGEEEGNIKAIYHGKLEA